MYHLILMNTDNNDDYLDEDPIIPSQRFLLVSIVSPASVKVGPDFSWKSVTPTGEPWEFRLMKPRYVCETMEQAEKMKARLQEIDSFHNIYIMPMGRWGPFEDDEDFCEDVEYKDKQANQIMKSFKEQQGKADEYDNQRRINAKKDADRRRKLMEKRNKIKESKVTQTLKETDHILANEIIAENLKGIDKLSIEELRAKSLILDNTLIAEQAKKVERDAKKVADAIEAEEKKAREAEEKAIKRAEQRERDGFDAKEYDPESDVEDIDMNNKVLSTAPINSTADMIAQDFLKNNTDMIKKRTDQVAKVDEVIDDGDVDEEEFDLPGGSNHNADDAEQSTNYNAVELTVNGFDVVGLPEDFKLTDSQKVCVAEMRNEMEKGQMLVLVHGPPGSGKNYHTVKRSPLTLLI
jgi:hypothetical protein